jgi:hypothetical protein
MSSGRSLKLTKIQNRVSVLESYKPIKGDHLENPPN